MKFTKTNDIIGLQPLWRDMMSGWSDRTIWVTDNRKCVITMYDMPNAGLYEASTRVTLYLRRPSLAVNEVECARDGVAGFIVKKLMDIANAYDCDMQMQEFRAHADVFLHALAALGMPENPDCVTLLGFYACKDILKDSLWGW